jgi:hypothetical protein
MERFLCSFALLLSLTACSVPSQQEAAEKASGSNISIQALKPTYRPLETLILRIRNGNSEDVFLDGCSGKVEDGSHRCSMNRLCNFATHEDVLRNMRRIPAGGTVRDTLFVNSCAAPGTWWVVGGAEISGSGRSAAARRGPQVRAVSGREVECVGLPLGPESFVRFPYIVASYIQASGLQLPVDHPQHHSINGMGRRLQ